MCIFIFHGSVDVIANVTFWGQWADILRPAQATYCIHTDFKIHEFIFRRQIYNILIYLLQRPYGWHHAQVG